MTDLAPIAAAIEQAIATPGPDAFVPPPADTSSLERQLYRGWWSIVLGIALAAAVYPVIFVVLGFAYQVISTGSSPVLFEFAIVSMLAVPYLIAVASFGFAWAGLVMVVNFVAALAIAHRGTPFEATWPAIMMLAAGLFFLFNGAGRPSLDAFLTARAARRPD